MVPACPVTHVTGLSAGMPRIPAARKANRGSRERCGPSPKEREPFRCGWHSWSLASLHMSEKSSEMNDFVRQEYDDVAAV